MDGWLAEVRSATEARLSEFFAEERKRLGVLGDEALDLIGSVESLTMRGGKRLRPAVLFAAHRAVRADGGVGDVVDACAGLELLQSYLLIHDDWMDDDAERRGGPASHAAFSKAHGDARLGASLAILAGNLANAQSWRLFERAASGARHARAVAIVLKMHEEVLVGQQLDLLAVEDVSRMHQLKTGSYTLRGPISLGAALADASAEQEAALIAFATPLGEAFQMRDDLLGTFGDPSSTGKPAGNDVREGKRTSLVLEAECRGSDAERAALSKVMSGDDRSEPAVLAGIEALESSGARAHVEGRLDSLIAEAEAALVGAPLTESGVGMLQQLARYLSHRKV